MYASDHGPQSSSSSQQGRSGQRLLHCEVATARLVLKHLQRAQSNDGRGTVSETEFMRILPAAGVRLGSHAADEVLNLCKPVENGRIDFSGFNLAVSRMGARLGTGQGAAYASRQDAERRRHLRNLGEDQAEKVKRLRREIQSLYTAHDYGTLTAQEFRDALVDLGLVETAVSRLFHQRGFHLRSCSRHSRRATRRC